MKYKTTTYTTLILTITTIVWSSGVGSAQNQAKTKVDTSKAMKQNVQPLVLPAPLAPANGQKRIDSLPAINPAYYDSAVKGAEYQNRGAEDRRSPTADPNVIPNKRVSDNQPTMPNAPAETK